MVPTLVIAGLVVTAVIFILLQWRPMALIRVSFAPDPPNPDESLANELAAGGLAMLVLVYWISVVLIRTSR